MKERKLCAQKNMGKDLDFCAKNITRDKGGMIVSLHLPKIKKAGKYNIKR